MLLLSTLEKDAKEIFEETEKPKARIMWSISAKEGISCQFDGTPIMSAGTIRFHCHKGADIDVAQKNKRKQRKDEEQVH